jgi:glycosyltransferase involved in cell wall biosynthesis
MTSPVVKIRIALHIDVIPGEQGGTVQSTQGLVRSLGQLDGPEQYILAAQTPDQRDWIAQYCGPSQEVRLRNPGAQRRATAWKEIRQAKTAKSLVKSVLRPALNSVRQVTGRLTPRVPAVPVSDGYYESLGCDLLHFPTQPFEVCGLPTIYNPHDLQHLHYPQFFSAEQLVQRETVYRAACNYSQVVVVGSEWIKQDVIRQYGTHPDKLQVIPWAAPTSHYPAINPAVIDETMRRLDLPAAFALYPAVTWPHKNHLRLLEAMAILRDREGLVVNLVLTGSKYESHWPLVQNRIRELNLEKQVRVLGFLPEKDLRAVYQTAQFLVLPSLFEADSCPIHEAWAEGLPVASSDIRPLADQVGDAGLLFDAKSVPAIASALRSMWCDAELRERLQGLGHRRSQDYSWERTAKAFRAVYRRTAGATLTEEDIWLLQWDWMRFPRQQAGQVTGQETLCTAINSYR